MILEKVTVSVEDGTMDCIGGVRTEYTILEPHDEEVFHLKGTSEFANVRLTLTGYELKRLHKLLNSGLCGL